MDARKRGRKLRWAKVKDGGLHNTALSFIIIPQTLSSRKITIH